MLTHKLLQPDTKMQPFPPLLGLLYPDNVGTKSLETPVTLYPATHCNIPEDFYEDVGTKSLETPGTLYPATHCNNNPEDFDLHQHSCGHNLKYRIPSFQSSILYKQSVYVTLWKVRVMFLLPRLS